MLFLYVWYRWIRLTTRRYGALAIPFQSARKATHAGVGRGVRFNPLGRAHGLLGEYSLSWPNLKAALDAERILT